MFETIVDPTVGPPASAERDQATLAARPDSLSGLRLGLLANTKRNAGQFLQRVGEQLAERHGIQVVLVRKKPNIVETAPEPMLAEFADRCDIVVTGVGDCGSCSASAVADGLLLEQAGVPAAVICTDAFIATADAMARLRGAPAYRYVTTAHPVANLTADGIRDRAVAAIPAIAALLTQPTVAATA